MPPASMVLAGIASFARRAEALPEGWAVIVGRRVDREITPHHRDGLRCIAPAEIPHVVRVPCWIVFSRKGRAIGARRALAYH